MAETVVYDGVGTTIAFATTGVTFELESLTPPGWERPIIDMTLLANTLVKTKKAGKLKDWGTFSVKCQLSPTKAFNSTFATNESIVITFPDSLGALTLWGFVSSPKPGEISEGSKGSLDLTVCVSNLNGSGVETAPSFA